MRIEKLFFALFIILLVPEAVSAATVYGTVYDFELNKIGNSIVDITTTPKQSFVSKDGEYSFTVPIGTYIITAKQNGNIAQEEIIVTGDGEFLIDLILFPDLSEEEEILDEAELDVTDEYFEEKNYNSYYLAVFLLVLLLVLAGVFVYFRRLKKQIKEEIKEIRIGEKADEIPVELKEVMDFIKKEGGRTTQKDIRRNFPQSEAKISLMIAELEALEKIKKIKKGRGNIIALK